MPTTFENDLIVNMTLFVSDTIVKNGFDQAPGADCVQVHFQSRRK